MKNLSFLVTFSMVLSILLSCNTAPVTTKSLEYGDNLKNAMDKFDASRQAFQDEVASGVGNTTKEMNKKDPNLPKVATDWEGQWVSIIAKYDKLEADFSLVGMKSDEYFAELDSISGAIGNETIKNSELRKNRDLKAKWTDNYLDAMGNLEKIRALLKDGKDFHLVLVASSMRQKIEENILELQSIAARAEELLKELEQFTIEGKKLVSAS